MSLTNEEIRVKIAESLGWIKLGKEWVAPESWGGGMKSFTRFTNPPNYPESLDACAEFESTLDPYTFRTTYWGYSAKERCLAYLKTKGLIP